MTLGIPFMSLVTDHPDMALSLQLLSPTQLIEDRCQRIEQMSNARRLQIQRELNRIQREIIDIKTKLARL